MRDLASLPKAHLHVHLESTIRPDTLRALAAANGVDIPEELSRSSFAGFSQFADYNAAVRASLCKPEDFSRVAVEFCEDEAAAGVQYAEVTFTAAAHGERLGQPEMPLEAVLRGLAAGEAAFGIHCRVLLDHSRRRSVERAWATLDLAMRYAGHGVVGIGMAGEESYELAPFTTVLSAAAEAGVPMVHHAGEMCGPSSIRDALSLGHSRRLGHGIRILEDADLVAEVRDRAIPLEVCPSSNVGLGLVASYADHPLPRLRAAGLTVSLNTDIPSVVGVSLTQEYTRVREAFGYDDATMAELARAGVDASFAPAPIKARVRSQIDNWLADGRGDQVNVRRVDETAR